ncbi:hypothetical protein SAMN02745168_0139 [Papillibacter cinnamivorans DSM 12816]|uniref:Uncharacterized protein n=1 Tax=Papillibacter cinnamivorans DSM 12816 TaxID=1122930 RepID=A0A1W2CPG4_9FIRM|nr:hypothetical protein SAMN02745168_0139 [Papillibacter cinnamivorans DSM 12816]
MDNHSPALTYNSSAYCRAWISRVVARMYSLVSGALIASVFLLKRRV